MASTLEVVLLQHTPDPERSVASAARLCYAPVSAAQLKEEMSEDEVGKLIRVLIASGHESALEHATFTFAIDGVSRACTHQLVRHRVASYSQQSQRYVRFENDFITPLSIAKNKEAKAIFEQAMKDCKEAYDKLVEIGMAEGRGKEAVQEDARFVLPNAAETKIVVTMNVRELRYFFGNRCCKRAQWEIRALALEMFRLCRHIAPRLFWKAGPSCVNGPCKEGRMTCGEPYSKETFSN
jgi:thymidylate synthase (FAD)